MCGIVGAIAQRDVTPILLEGLRRLEYRGYDSAGVAVLGADGELNRVRVQGKVRELVSRIDSEPLPGGTGIAHTRWATHGEPSEENAHPHLSGSDVALVHNGIIENHLELRGELETSGYVFTSQTDTEVIVHLLHKTLQQSPDLLAAVQAAKGKLQGAYAIAVISGSDPGRLVVARRGSPLVIGIGIGEHFIASDKNALLPVTQRFITLEEGDVAAIQRDCVAVFADDGSPVERAVSLSQLSADSAEKSGYRHFMLKEIHTQPVAVADTIKGTVADGRVLDETFGEAAARVFDAVDNVQIVACGTSYHAGLIARYWLEAVAGIPCAVEVASEFRYRQPVLRPGTLFVTISQSGETADTIAALRQAREIGFECSLAICNVPESSLTRESDLVFLTQAGPEIGVASTKAFTTQLVALLLLTLALGRRKGIDAEAEGTWVEQLNILPGVLNAALELDAPIKQLAAHFADKHHSLYLGRGPMYPVAMEGALKLKEISYIHAEAYPAGELKHGPLALVDEDMPVIAVAPNDELLEKVNSNLEEVRARGGELFIFSEAGMQVPESPGVTRLSVPSVPRLFAPIVYAVPLQLFAYHVAVIKGADVDQPRNLAKSVTVE